MMGSSNPLWCTCSACSALSILLLSLGVMPLQGPPHARAASQSGAGQYASCRSFMLAETLRSSMLFCALG